MSIADKISRLSSAKSGIASAIALKGGTVGADDGFEDFASDIGTIPEAELVTKSITANGTYNASADNADGYSSVTVNVSPSASFVGYSSSIFGNLDVIDAAYGNEMFVITTSMNGIRYSSDGINWTSVPQPSGANGIGSIAYGNGMFVAIPSPSVTVGIYSYDGINWSTMTMPHSGYWAVGYGEGKFVALTRASTQAAYSTDGIHWTETTASSAYWVDVAYGNGMFVGTGLWGSYSAVYSTDGITWNNSNLMYKNLGHVAYGNNTFVALYYENTTTNVAHYSTDGIHWAEAALPFSANWAGITYGNGTFIAIAQNTDKAVCSRDGINWTQINMPSNGQWRTIAYGDGKFVASGFGIPMIACCDVRTNIV